MDNDKLTIVHSGVKGMKWGVRNEETLMKYGLLNRTRKNSQIKERSSNPKQETRKRIKERRKAEEYSSLLSDKELDKRIKRLEKEKRLRELTDSEINSGRKTTKDFLLKHGDKMAAIVATAIAVEVGKQLVAGSAAKRVARESAMKDKYEKIYSRNAKINDKVISSMGKVGSTATRGVRRVGSNIASGYGIIGKQIGTNRRPQDTLAYKVGRRLATSSGSFAGPSGYVASRKYGKHAR